MPITRKVVVSYAAEDAQRCQPLLAALDAWGVDYYASPAGEEATQALAPATQKALAERDTFLRICTGAAQRSLPLNLEANAFRGLQAEDRKHGRGKKRLFVNLILASDYHREPFDNATLFVDGVSRPRAVWMADLGRALGAAAPASRRVSRRAMLGYGAAALVTLGSTAAAADLFITNQQQEQSNRREPGKIVWQLNRVSSKKGIPPLPTVTSDRLYVVTASALIAYDLNTRRRLWDNAVAAKFLLTSPTVDHDVVYLTVDNGVYAFNAATGSNRWTAHVPGADTGDFANSSVVAGGVVYTVTDSGKVYAFSARDGTLRWGTGIEQASISLDTANSSPTVAGDLLYIGSLDHQLYALNVKDGSPRWKFLTRGAIVSTPAVADGLVYFGSHDAYVYAVSASDGALKWKYHTQGDIESSPTVADGVVYIGSDDGYLYALDAQSGKPYWRSPVGDFDSITGDVIDSGPIIAAPAVTGDAVAINDSTHFVVRAYNRHDGSGRWFYLPKNTEQNTNPIAANGLFLFGGGDQNLYAFGA